MSVLSFSLPRLSVGLALVLSLSACNIAQDLELPRFGRAEAATPEPVMRWDHRPEAGEWTQAAFLALDTHASALPDIVPADIDTWCPEYRTADEAEREAFWTGLLSALARYESTWNPEVVGGGGRYFGLVQISPATARYYGCDATDGSALTNGAANISCALRIWAATVSRDGVVSEGRGGVAADWGPMTRADMREEMRAWVSTQPYCAG